MRFYLKKFKYCILLLAFLLYVFDIVGCSLGNSNNFSSESEKRKIGIEVIATQGQSTAWIATNQEKLYLSSDLEKWVLVSHGKINGVEALFFLNSKVGWYVDGKGKVFTTKDGGKAWGNISLIYSGNPVYFSPARFISFLDEKNGWMCSSYAVWKTDDGGNTWIESIPSSFTSVKQLIHSEAVINNNEIWLGGEQGIVYHTADGGISWEGKKVGNVTDTFLSAKFFNQREGIFVSHPNGNMLITADGGKSWLSADLGKYSGVFAVRSVSFVSNEEIFVAGSRTESQVSVEGSILKTENSGKTWAHVDNLPREKAFDFIHFFNKSRGILISDSNVYVTKNGGLSWELSTSLH